MSVRRPSLKSPCSTTSAPFISPYHVSPEMIFLVEKLREKEGGGGGAEAGGGGAEEEGGGKLTF